MADAHKNFAYSTVATAPSPAASGTSLVVASGEGARFPAAPFNAVIWPTGTQPLSSNAEIVRVTARSTDTLTITRAQESTSARTVVVGDQIAAAITAKTLTDIEPLVITDAPSANQNDYAPTGWTTTAARIILEVTPSNPIVITGFSALAAGAVVDVRNKSADLPIVITDESVTSSSAANRVKVQESPFGGGHFVLYPNCACTILYDGTASRWVIINENVSTLLNACRQIQINGGLSTPTSNAVAVTGISGTIDPPASGSYLSEQLATGHDTTSAAGTAAGHRTAAMFMRGSAARRGGFIYRTSFAWKTNPANAGAFFVGIRSSITSIGNVNPSTLVSVFGVSTDPSDTTVRRIKNDSTGTATTNDLGANYPITAGTCYEFMIFAPSNGSGLAGIIWRNDDLSITPLVWYDTTDIPANNISFGLQCHVCNRAAAAVYAISFMQTRVWLPK